MMSDVDVNVNVDEESSCCLFIYYLSLPFFSPPPRDGVHCSKFYDMHDDGDVLPRLVWCIVSRSVGISCSLCHNCHFIVIVFVTRTRNPTALHRIVSHRIVSHRILSIPSFPPPILSSHLICLPPFPHPTHILLSPLPSSAQPSRVSIYMLKCPATPRHALAGRHLRKHRQARQTPRRQKTRVKHLFSILLPT